ncbi:hypothetical protein GCM10011505_40650 [Tistrella bauzanensis]|uniref:DUF2254 domain-containing protein n=1 Tax=Tistrella bauzanensis TaxID=657419 RepID=A0ABQ1J191_9PROT|nr:DUF2254 domain-containing protein [Tistrella bauzanensis]GGB55534.1 hypothetical protein GCM10011505_40650 [Tistrella bauzanensis]
MMRGSLLRTWTRLRETLWLRPAAASALAALWVGLAIVIGPYMPGEYAIPVPDKDAIVELLKLGGGSLLTIATVTLSVLMVVLNAASGQASPRALPGLMSDGITQNALATFVAGFVYAVAGIVVLGLGRDGTGARLLIGLGGLLSLALALFRMVMWFHHIADTLKLSSMIDRIFRSACRSVGAHRAAPGLGVRLRRPAGTSGAEPHSAESRHSTAGGAGTGAARGRTVVRPAVTGYLRLIDTARLAALAEQHQLLIDISNRPGIGVHPLKPLATVRSRDGGAVDDAVLAVIGECFDIGRDRIDTQDPLFSLELLCETACRALSPGINDPETAEVCLDRLEALLADLVADPPGQDMAPDTDRLGPGAAHVTLPALTIDALVDRALMRIARCGAGAVEVVCRLVGVLAVMAREARNEGDADVARRAAVQVHAYAHAALTIDHDLARVDAALADMPQ